MTEFGGEDLRYFEQIITRLPSSSWKLIKQSYLACTKSTAEFYGHLDIKTLGGAGFASQRTTGDDRKWDLSDYEGIELVIENADKKQYTFILKDQLLPPDSSTGREQSTISYEYDFCATADTSNGHSTLIYIPWEELKATYRGKEKKDAPLLSVKEIRRMSLMMRSFFGTQEGGFSLTIRSIAATTVETSSTPTSGARQGSGSGRAIGSFSCQSSLGEGGQKPVEAPSAPPDQGFFSWLLGKCLKL